MSCVRFNPFTGNFVPVRTRISDAEIARIFSKVKTTTVNALGNPHYTFDSIACKWVEVPPQIVVDENGCIVIDPENC